MLLFQKTSPAKSEEGNNKSKVNDNGNRTASANEDNNVQTKDTIDFKSEKPSDSDPSK